jgi:DNA polymerase-3 subunit gamma/tau
MPPVSLRPIMYQVLAHKWRPKTLSQVVGQQAILQILKNSLKRNKLHHAYLFTGVRGIGKTTIARVFAKCLNCVIGMTDEPCEICESCMSINQGNCIDLIEVDAASRTKVEDTKELLANVQYLPVSNRFKIYIIDEVHMLSNHSFNALLKTLEEPPEHVKFLFATTDPQKLPATVLSRCLQFKLRKFTLNEIAEHLINILNAEKHVFHQEAIYMVAKAADGSMRDAITMLEQVLAFGDNDVSVDCIQEILGIPNIENIYQILEYIFQQDAEKSLNIINLLAKNTSDFVKILQELQVVLHRIAILQEVPAIYDQDKDVFKLERLKLLANILKAEEVQLYYQISINGLKDLPYASDLKSGFEMVILRMIAFNPARVAPVNFYNHKIELSEPEIVTPEIIKPEIVKPKIVKPEIITPEIVKPKIVKPKIVKPKIVKPKIVKPEIITPEIVKPKIVKPKIVKPKIVKPEIVKPEIVKPEIVKPEIVKPKIVKSKIVKSKIVKPKIVKPKIVKPKIVKPEIVKPEIVKPKIVKSKIAKNTIVITEVPQAEIAQPAIAMPELAIAHIPDIPKSAPTVLPNWMEIVSKLNLFGISVHLAHHCTIVVWDNNGVIELKVAANQSFFLRPATSKELQQALKEYLKKDVKLIITSGQQQTDTPAIQINKINQQKKQEVEEKVYADPILQQILKSFNGNVEEIKIREFSGS